jgi:hypothetical protein
MTAERVTGTTGVYHRYYRSLGFRPFEPAYRHTEVGRRIDLSVLPVFHRYYRWSSVLPVVHFHANFGTEVFGRENDLPVLPAFHRYYQWPPVLLVEYRYYRQFKFLAHLDAELSQPVLPVKDRYYRCTLAEIFFLSVRECKGVSQAHYIDRHEHYSSHLASLICIPLDSAAFPLTQAKIKIYRSTWAETLFHPRNLGVLWFTKCFYSNLSMD